MTSPDLLTTFVHGYEDDSYEVSSETLPALWRQTPTGRDIYSYPFPRNVADFESYSDLIDGEQAAAETEDFTRRPRFGLTGASLVDDRLFAGSWNGVYEIDVDDGSLRRIISNRLMNDLHGIYVDENTIYTVLTGTDTVVLSDHSGEVLDYFSIERDLSVAKDPELLETDWRFISKQFRGATGHWHFNNIERIGDELWLTSRNASCFVVVDLEAREAMLRLINFSTPALIHDGVWHQDGNCYLTSIDGKVFKVAPAEEASFNPRGNIEAIHLFNRDMVSEVVRLQETDFGREPNWCRGIGINDESIFVTVDGRYGTSYFGLVEMNWEGDIYNQSRLDWADIGNEDQIRYVTGFDIEID